MNNYLIFMDVSGDIGEGYEKTELVHLIPMEYSLGEKMINCDRAQTRDELKLFYDSQRNGDLTKTSQISPFMYQQYFEPYMKEGYSILYLCLSSGLSNTIQSANIAKAALKDLYPEVDLYPLDTLSATAGMGVLAERAVRNLESGMSIEENYEDVNAAKAKVCHWFLVQDLMYLKRGGRISGTTAVVGTALKIVPILKIDSEGRLENFEKKRGYKAAMKQLVDLFTENYDPESVDPIYIVDSDADDLGEQLRNTVQEMYPEKTVRRTSLSPIIGAHTGPGLAAIVHMKK